MLKPLKPVACSLKPNRTAWAIVGMCLLGTLSTACVTAYVAIGVTAVGIGAAALAFECDEPVNVSVWDPGTAHVVCDAVVTASSGKNTVELEPCYTTLLGAGTWTVTAVKPGRPTATGIITIDREHRCKEPVYHSLELTLANAPAVVPAPAAPPPTTAPAAPPPATMPAEPAPVPPPEATTAPPVPSAR
jgi:hypothetical protein